MTKRPEDLSGDELRALADDLDERIDVLSDDDEAAAELIEQQSEVGREISKREALETRRSGGYSATFDVAGDEVEYELRARNQSEAEAEARSGAESMASVSGQIVTIKHINGPLVEGGQ